MTTGTKIALGIGVVGVGAAAVMYRGWIYLWLKSNFRSAPKTPPVGAAFDPFVAAGPMIDPFAPAPLATLPVLPPYPLPPPLPLGQTPDLPSGFGVVASAGVAMRGSAPSPPPPPPPALPIATSVGTLYLPPGSSQDQAYAKVNDLAAIYASSERPEGSDTYFSPPVVAAVTRTGRGHF